MQQPTGISAYTQNILPSLASLEPTLLTSDPIADYNYYPIPNRLSPDHGTIAHFRRLWWTQQQLPNLYHQLNASLLFSPVPEAPLYSPCRYVVTVHDLIPLRYPRWSSPLTPYFRVYIPQVLKQAEHIICNSQATADDIIQFWNIPAKKITPILLAYNQQHFTPAATPQHQNYFLYLGRHDPHKNVQRLLQAFSQVSLSDTKLWLGGPTDDRYTPKLKQQVAALELRDRVRFLDYIPYDHLPDLIRGATALVFPSLWEGFGLPVLEAMGCGTPVITSNCASLPEVAGDAAILIDPTNTDEMTNAMTTIAKNSHLRSELRKQGLKRASQFSWEKTGQATVEVLREFL
ncbi:MAG: glycosyltransferase family 1 protein [Halothece sp. Uz-M2-17]|nr:glycosyltransferase family 1 protein [Halothece sp. Uz-M2-17]